MLFPYSPIQLIPNRVSWVWPRWLCRLVPSLSSHFWAPRTLPPTTTTKPKPLPCASCCKAGYSESSSDLVCLGLTSPRPRVSSVTQWLVWQESLCCSSYTWPSLLPPPIRRIDPMVMCEVPSVSFQDLKYPPWPSREPCSARRPLCHSYACVSLNKITYSQTQFLNDFN